MYAYSTYIPLANTNDLFRSKGKIKSWSHQKGDGIAILRTSTETFSLLSYRKHMQSLRTLVQVYIHENVSFTEGISQWWTYGCGCLRPRRIYGCLCWQVSTGTPMCECPFLLLDTRGYPLLLKLGMNHLIFVRRGGENGADDKF